MWLIKGGLFAFTGTEEGKESSFPGTRGIKGGIFCLYRERREGKGKIFCLYQEWGEAKGRSFTSIGNGKKMEKGSYASSGNGRYPPSLMKDYSEYRQELWEYSDLLSYAMNVLPIELYIPGYQFCFNSILLGQRATIQRFSVAITIASIERDSSIALESHVIVLNSRMLFSQDMRQCYWILPLVSRIDMPDLLPHIGTCLYFYLESTIFFKMHHKI